MFLIVWINLSLWIIAWHSMMFCSIINSEQEQVLHKVYDPNLHVTKGLDHVSKCLLRQTDVDNILSSMEISFLFEGIRIKVNLDQLVRKRQTSSPLISTLSVLKCFMVVLYTMVCRNHSTCDLPPSVRSPAFRQGKRVLVKATGR